MLCDVVISALLALLTIAMAYLGVHVTLHPTESPTLRKRYKWGFCLCALATVGLVVWQGVRNGRSQIRTSAQITALQGEVRDTKAASVEAKNEANKLRGDLHDESVRRQQAEKDLTGTVESSGKATRTGVAEDFRKSPIRVEGSPLSVIREADIHALQRPIEKNGDLYGVLVTVQFDAENNGPKILFTFDEAIENISASLGPSAWSNGDKIYPDRHHYYLQIMSPPITPETVLTLIVHSKKQIRLTKIEKVL